MMMTLNMNARLLTTRVAIVLSAALFLIAQTVMLSADAAKTPAATDQASHKGNHNFKHVAADGKPQATTSPLSLQVVEIIGTDGKRTTTYADGTVITVTPGADPRWSMQSPITASYTIRTPAGLTYTKLQARAVTLANPNDPLSLLTITETLTTNGRASTNVYTAASRTLLSTSAAGRQSSILVDTQGRMSSLQIAGLSARQFTYDHRGRPETITQGSGADTRTITFAYSPQGFLSSLTDPLMRIVTFDRDAAGRITRQTLPDGREIGFTYDANSNVTSITPPSRPAHIFTFTALNFLEDYTPPIVGTGANLTRSTYDADRKLDLITRPDATIVDFGYDLAGRPSTLVIPRGQTSLSYHPTSGNLATLTAPDGGLLTYNYDGNLLTSEAWSGTIAGTLQRTYNNDFRVASESLNGVQTITFQYDNDGLLAQAGNLTISRSAQNGFISGTTLGSVTDAWSYNSFGEPVNYLASHNGSPIYSAQYNNRDKLGRIRQKVETIGGVTDTYDYTYNPLSARLTGVQKNGLTIATYTYDSNGNRQSYSGGGAPVIGTYDDQDRLMQYGANTYSHTVNGELLSKMVAGQTTTYEYDALNSLISVNLPGGTQIDYVIDGNFRRIGKRLNGVLVQGLLYQDGLRVLAELDGSNNVVSRFIYGARQNVPEYMIRGGVTYRLISDHLGSPRMVVNVATGAIAQRLDYDEFGVVLADTNPGFQPFGFAGGLYDTHTKLVRFGARDYDAETGRWTAKDPILFAGGDTNLYGYVLNDPVNWLDPTGTQGTPLADALYQVSPQLRKFHQELSQNGENRAANLEALLRRRGYRNPNEVQDDWLFRRGLFDEDSYGDSHNEPVDPYESGNDAIGDSLRAVPPNSGGGSSQCPQRAPRRPPCNDCDDMIRRHGRIVAPCQVWPPCP